MEPIAITGMSFRFPGGAESSEDFWDMLVGKKCAAAKVPQDRFNVDAFWSADPKKQNTISTREGHFLQGDIKNFDAGFFSMAPHEVGAMDPQQRGLMENTYHAFENAGLRLEDVAGTKTSVHVGCFTSDFATMQFRDAQSIPKYNALGTAGSMLANRLSWFFDLRGESMYIDTACSSSLVALALACQGLAAGESEMAVVSGSNLILIPEFAISLSNMKMLSPTGRCQSFDAKADGYGRGEGFATLILKNASKAIADGDPIRALIRSVGMNQDGYTSSGITQPSKDMQVKLIRETYRKAGLDMKHTRFFEAHGTGTAVGDPIEARAIGEAFFNHRSKEDPIYVGAVKSNIGHLEGSSGLAGIVKTVLALERGIVPPNTNFETLNPQIDAEFFNLEFPSQCIPWPKARSDQIRRASVNSFGFGGSNSHAVLEAADGYLQVLGHRLPCVLSLHKSQPASLDYPQSNGSSSHYETQLTNGHTELPTTNGHAESPITNGHAVSTSTNGHTGSGTINGHVNGSTQSTSQVQPRPRLLILSASDEDGIARQARDLSQVIDCFKHDGDYTDVVDDIVFTLNMRRTLLEWKSYAILRASSASTDLEDVSSKPVRHSKAAAAHLGLIFTGQGAQWPRMGAELLDWPVFAASLERSQKCLETLTCDWSLIDELVAHNDTSRVNSPEISQAVTTAVQIALVDLIRVLGIKPSVVVGHSSGEIAAAYCAGYLSQDSAMKVSYHRGVLASKLARESRSQPWGMASVGIPAKELPLELKKVQQQHPTAFDAADIFISCINCPTNTTISGPIASIDVLLGYLSSKQVFARKLKVDVGYHSPQMNLVSSEYLGRLSDLRPGTPVSGIKMVSSVSADIVDVDCVGSAEYWVQNMLSPVRFSDAVGLCSLNSSTSDEVTCKLLDRSHSQRICVDGWLELGPHAALKGPLREILASHMRGDALYTSLLVRNKSACMTALEAVGQLFCQGFEVDLAQTARVHAKQAAQSRTVVDLPKYPFNHSISHWEESSRSKSFQSRLHASHPLLGVQMMDWNPLDARWGFTIKAEEIPWVSDHRLHGNMWYPAAGMVVMAVEAVKQLLPDSDFDFELQNVNFTSPIVVSEEPAGTETQISMVPTSRTGSQRETDYKFRILVRRVDDSWDQACDGIISPKRTTVAALDINKYDEEEEKSQKALTAYKKALASCQSTLESPEMYRKVSETSGLQYGPSFQGLTHIHYNEHGQAHATLAPLEDSVAESSQPYTIHPASLDSIFQLTIPALSEGLTKSLPTLVPSRVTRLWISRNGAGVIPSSSQQGSERVYAEAEFSSKRSAVSSTTVFSETADMGIRVQVEELETVEVAREQEVATSDHEIASISHEMVWKADPTILDHEEMLSYCSRQRNHLLEPTEWYEGVRIMILGFIKQAFDEIRQSELSIIPSMDRYATWLQARLSAHNSSKTQGINDSLPSGPELQKLGDHFISTGHRGTFGVLIGRQLRQILTGEIDPLQTLFADPQSVANMYEELNATGTAFPMLQEYLDTLVHKDPGLRFLEVGAGTGATTSIVLDTIADPNQGPRYSEYIFTDISEFFYPKAQERFKMFDRVRYCNLNIEHEDFWSQNVAAGMGTGYDVIVAANVLHVTKDLLVTLRNARGLLKPHGKLILMEMTAPNNIETGFVWGTLPGWWLGSESFRQQSPVIEEDRWNGLLKQAGFTGTDLVFRDWDTEVCHGWSIMVATALPDVVLQDEHACAATAIPPGVTLVIDNEPSELQTRVAGELQRALIQPGDSKGPEVALLNQVTSLPDDDIGNRHCILLVDLEEPKLQSLDSTTFKAYQRLLTAPRSLLWVQMRDEQSDRPPYWSMVEGLCRVCRSEHPFIRIVTLILETPAGGAMESQITPKISRIFKATNPATGLAESEVEEEYMEVSGYMCVNRLRQAKYLDQHVFSRAHNTVRPRKFGSGCPVKLNIRTPGLLDSLEWVEDTAAYEPLAPHHVEVQVRAIGVNFKDCLIYLGRVNFDKPGSECAGYITRVGRDVKNLAPGDRVAVGAMGTYQSLVRSPESLVVKIPDFMSFEDAAGIPTAFVTAYYSLHMAARLQKGESILIHAAAGGTGQAAVQVAQAIGAEIFVTVGSKSKRDILIERYGILEDHIFYSRNDSFAEGVKRVTNGRGVDVVLNSLSGKLLVASWELIAEFGRFVEIGRKDIDTRGHLPMFPFIKNASFIGVDLAAMVSDSGHRHENIMRDIFQMMASGTLKPSYPVQSLPINQAEQAFRLLVSGKSTGKIILDIQDDALVPFMEGEDSDYRFSSEATYVIAGGLGGIGRQIARWLVRRGATNILLLSRSHPEKHPERPRTISALRQQGVNLQYQVCDIADLESLKEAVQMAERTMPPIKGCFQAAMVIQDRTFTAMTHEDWCASVGPKVQGSWNLHTTLPSGMDFFVMLSSAVCIFGNPGQANYAAGNTFLDALARYRLARGEKAVTIDLGMIQDEGWVAERKEMQHRVMQLDQVLPISQQNLFSMFDYYCNPAVVLDSPSAAQAVTGIQLPALIVSSGRQVPEMMYKPLFRAMHQVVSGGATSATGTTKAQDAAAVFAEAETLEQAGVAVAEALKTKLCKMLGLEDGTRTINDRMESFGVDSLIALEVRNWLAKEMRADLAVYEILGDVKIIDTGMVAARKSEYRQAHW